MIHDATAGFVSKQSAKVHKKIKIFFLFVFTLKKMCTFALGNGIRSIAGSHSAAGGKSGQHRATILPNGKGRGAKAPRHRQCHRNYTAVVFRDGKGEIARQELTPAAVMSPGANLMG